MARYEHIETNPTALRHIASDISSYTTLQVRILDEYLKVISQQEGEITTRAFQEAVQRVDDWKRKMERLKEDSDSFVQYLKDRAEKITAMENGK